MSGQTPTQNQPNSNQILAAMTQALQAAAETANRYDRDLDNYREHFGHIRDIRELLTSEEAPDLLSARFAMIKAARDEQRMKANVLANKIFDLQNGRGNGSF